jgi:hypothetical protein
MSLGTVCFTSEPHGGATMLLRGGRGATGAGLAALVAITLAITLADQF